MIDSLKFVRGSVAKKDIIPALTHFLITGGRIKGYNGRIALSSPIDLGIDCQPKAIDLINAIEACQTTVHLNMTPAGRLTVKSGNFKTHVNCVQESFPDIEPEGDLVAHNGNLLPALKILEPMIAEDASRQWARGILFRGQFAHATNNVVICQYWLGYHFPFDLVIPHDAVNELLRINEEPITIQVTSTSVTFHFDGGRWLRTQTNSTEWPAIERVLDKPGVSPSQLPDNFAETLETLRPFVDDLSRCYFIDGHMATSTEEGVGTRIEHCPVGTVCFPVDACYNLNQLRLIAKVANSFDFKQQPALFFGDNLRGAISAMRFV